MMLTKECKERIARTAITIQNCEDNEEILYYSKLVKLLSEHMSRRELSLSYDILFDNGYIHEEWKEKNGQFYRSIQLSECGRDILKSSNAPQR